jgi:hypothetical protein
VNHTLMVATKPLLVVGGNVFFWMHQDSKLAAKGYEIDRLEGQLEAKDHELDRLQNGSEPIVRGTSVVSSRSFFHSPGSIVWILQTAGDEIIY